MRALLAASVATSLFLLLASALGLIQTVTMYLTYGLSYVETVTINGQDTVRTIRLQDNLFSILLLAWISLLLLLESRAMIREGRSSGGLPAP